MTVINLDNDERFKVNQVNVKFDGKEYNVVADDNTIKKVVKNTKAFFNNAKTFDDVIKEFEDTDLKKLTNKQVDTTINSSIDYVTKQRTILINALNTLFGNDIGDLIYAKKHSTNVLSTVYDDVVNALYEVKDKKQHEKMKKLVKKAKKVK